MFIESQTEDVGKAHPRIVEAVEAMLKKGKWTVPGAFVLAFFWIHPRLSILSTLRLQGEVWRPQPYVITGDP
jgi:hypothetical protein